MRRCGCTLPHTRGGSEHWETRHRPPKTEEEKEKGQTWAPKKKRYTNFLLLAHVVKLSD